MSVFYLYCLLICLTRESALEETHNGLLPSGPAKTLVFQQDLKLGPDSGGDAYLWQGTYVTVEVTHAGHMFVVDTGGNRVLEFGSEGTFVRQIGRTGQGPGEFSGLMSFTILDDQTAVAFDSQQSVSRFHIFDQTMTFTRTVRVPGNGLFLSSGSFSSDGGYFGGVYVKPRVQGSLNSFRVGLLNLQGEEQMALSQEVQGPFDPQSANQPSWWSVFLADRFKLAINGPGVIAFGNNGTVFTAVTNRYQVTRWSPDLKAELVVNKAYKPLPQSEADIMSQIEPIRDEVLGRLPQQMRQLVTEKVIGDAITLAGFSYVKQPIFGILPMDGGGFLVIHDYQPKTGACSADIFSKEGIFLGRTTLPPIEVNLFAGFFGAPPKLRFKGGKAYAILVDDESEYCLVRYRVRWQ